jgi:dual specificity MAP kinase phosphatase
MKKRSFFVYETDVRLLKAVEDRLARDRRAKLPTPRRFLFGPTRAHSLNSDVCSSAMSASYDDPGNAPIVSMRRPRASTSPLLPSLVDDHQVWFDDPRFDGSFPSRVLPFLYLGNLCVSLLHPHIISFNITSMAQKSRSKCVHAPRSWYLACGLGR